MSKRNLRSRTRTEDLESPKKVPKKDEKKVTKTTTRPKLQSSKPATPKRQPAKSKAKAKPQTQLKKAIINGKENKETTATPKRKREVKKPKVEELYSDDDDDDDDDEEEEEKTPVKRKRRKIVVPSDDSSGDDSDEYKPSDASDSDASISSAAASSEVDTSLNNTADTVSDDEPPPKREQKPRNPGRGKKWYPNKKKVEDDDESGKSFQLAKAKLQSGPVSGAESWPHLKYPFLQPENILDAEKRRPDHPEYNPKTLYVPQEFLDKQTPSMRQWWTLKSQHFDCVLFHKIGKFYGLYHMDAVSGVNALGLNFIQRDFAYTGCFEVNYSRLFKTFVEKGYKVARVEQTETPQMMAKRCNKSKSKASKFDKLVRREVCQISTRGTRVSTVLDIENFSSHSNYLLSLVEDHSNKLPTYGICFIDTSIGIFHLGQFKDDCHNSRLLTLLSHYTPAHVVYGKGNLSPVTMKILNTHLPVTTLKEALLKDQFWSVKVILDKLKDSHYFKYESDEFSWPEGLKPFINYHDNNKTVNPVNDKKLAINALGGCVSVLTECVLDEQLLALKKFQTYIPPDMNVVDGKRVGPLVNMVIDAATIENLNILGKSPSLLTTLDYCCTDFGKRLLKEWVCRPACNRDIITARIDAVSELRDLKRICLNAKKQLSSLPDLERLLTTIHGHGNASKVKNHPDSRAIMCEWMTYNKRKITDLVICINGFKQVVEIIKLFDSSLVSDLIVQTTQVEPKGEFPDMTEALNHFDARFDSELALKQGCIIPKKGMDLEYDQVIVELEQVKNDADEYLKSQSEYFGTEIEYIGGGDNPYQLEVPESCASKVTPDYELEHKRKGFKRYSTEQTIKLQKRQTAAEEHHDKVRKDSDRRTFAKFSENYDMWATAVYKVAVLDVLISLAEYSRIGDKCAPEINDTDEVMLDIQEGIHPFITSENFVPNNTSLAINDYGPLVILTGPNMGGKSTIMRQVGLLSIMAHIGCHIPAQSCKLSLIDRVFTRLGANDDMRTGRSTFLVELSEAATFVLHATKNSLVLVDELGRGTSTHDGTAIAAAILKALSKLECRTLFSTHYHMLVSEFKDNPAVSPAHMACQVESEETDATQETVTFLYKLTKGPCPKSYGFNAARIAGIKSHITRRANELAKDVEDAGNRRNLFISLCSVNRHNIKEILATLDSFSN